MPIISTTDIKHYQKHLKGAYHLVSEGKESANLGAYYGRQNAWNMTRKGHYNYNQFLCKHGSQLEESIWGWDLVTLMQYQLSLQTRKEVLNRITMISSLVRSERAFQFCYNILFFKKGSRDITKKNSGKETRSVIFVTGM